MSAAKFNLYNELGTLVQTGTAPLSIPVAHGVTYSGYTITHLNYDGTKESAKTTVPSFSNGAPTTTATTTVAK